jgi:hypothetical protein
MLPASAGALLLTWYFVCIFDQLREQPALNAGDEGKRDNDSHPVSVLGIDKHGFLVIGNKNALKFEERTFTGYRCRKYFLKNIHTKEVLERSGFKVPDAISPDE